MIEKCQVKILSNKVICDSKIEDKTKENKEDKLRKYENIKNKKKYEHLIDIGVNIDKYHPTVIRNLVDGGRIKVPDNIKPQITEFTSEAHQKGFNPALFGYNTTLHKSIKQVHNIPTRKYITSSKKQGGDIIEKVSDVNSTDSETNMDDVLSDIETDLKTGNIKDVKKKMKQYRHKIPASYYTAIMKNVNKK